MLCFNEPRGINVCVAGTVKLLPKQAQQRFLVRNAKRQDFLLNLFEGTRHEQKVSAATDGRNLGASVPV